MTKGGPGPTRGRALSGRAGGAGITELNPEGLTAATGKWAEQVAARLKAGGMTCTVMNVRTKPLSSPPFLARRCSRRLCSRPWL